MKIESQVCTLEQALKLKELGVKQDSIFIYDTGVSHKPLFNGTQKLSPITLMSCYSAFTVAELGVMLPNDCISIVKNDGVFIISYWTDGYKVRFESNFLSAAIADLIIHLIEKKLIAIT